jgi:hypothetical protein
MRIVPSRIYWCEVRFSYTDYKSDSGECREGVDDYCCVEWFGMGKYVIIHISSRKCPGLGIIPADENNIEIDSDGVPHLVRVDKDGNDQGTGYWRDWANYIDGILQEEWET